MFPPVTTILEEGVQLTINRHNLSIIAARKGGRVFHADGVVHSSSTLKDFPAGTRGRILFINRPDPEEMRIFVVEFDGSKLPFKVGFEEID
jgi:hypothetical protein